jgi:hypothetical protein
LALAIIIFWGIRLGFHVIVKPCIDCWKKRNGEEDEGEVKKAANENLPMFWKAIRGDLQKEWYT